MSKSDILEPITFHEVVTAYLECRKHKRDSVAAVDFEVNLEENLLRLYRELCDGCYRISPSIAFVVEKPVKREVFAADFRDRIVHHLLMKMLIPHFEREFVYDSYACRPNRGTLFGVRRIKRFVAQCSEGYIKDCYILKCDISGFFMNIDRSKLWNMLAEFIKQIDFGDRRYSVAKDLFTEPIYTSSLQEFVLRLTKQIVMHDPVKGCHINGSKRRWNGLPADKSLFSVNGKPMPNGFRGKVAHNNTLKGLPIGNLTSQWFGNFYLNRLDHFVKHRLGIRYYGRYVDDFVIVHRDKEHLKRVVSDIENFLRGELGLRLHPKKRYLQHYSKGVTFLGVTIREGTLLVGNRTKQGVYRVLYRSTKVSNERVLSDEELLSVRDSLNSYWGMMKHHSSYKLREKIATRLSSQLKERLYCHKGYCKVSKRKWIVCNGGFPVRCEDIWRKRLIDEQENEICKK